MSTGARPSPTSVVVTAHLSSFKLEGGWSANMSESVVQKVAERADELLPLSVRATTRAAGRPSRPLNHLSLTITKPTIAKAQIRIFASGAVYMQTYSADEKLVDVAAALVERLRQWAAEGAPSQEASPKEVGAAEDAPSQEDDEYDDLFEDDDASGQSTGGGDADGRTSVAPSSTPTITHVRARYDIGFPLHLEHIAYIYGHYSSYEPELFPALIYRQEEPTRYILQMYTSGIILTHCAYTGFQLVCDDIQKRFVTDRISVAGTLVVTREHFTKTARPEPPHAPRAVPVAVTDLERLL